MTILTTQEEITADNGLFMKDVTELLVIIQKIVQSKDEEFTKGTLIDFFANLSANLVINSGVCSECFLKNLNDIFEVGKENGMVTSHELGAEHLH